MADETDKLIIEIDADTGQFQVKMGSIQDIMKQASSEGASGFNGLAESMIGLNQGLELAEKLMNGVSQALETVNKAEAFDNQSTALKNLGAQVGLTNNQVKLMVETMIKASGDTMTTGEATAAAFKLLNAGFKSETLPNLIEFAKRAEETRNIPIAEGIQKLSMALESGSLRGLKQMGIEMATTGSRAQIMNAILEQTQSFVSNTGTGYESFGKRMSTAFSEAKESATNFFGTILRNAGIGIFGTQTEKTQSNLTDLKQKLQEIDDVIAKSGEHQKTYFQGLHSGGYVEAGEARKKILAEIAGQQDQVNTALKAEGAVLDSNAKKFASTKALAKPTDAIQAAQDRIKNQELMYAKLQSDDQAYAKDAVNIAKQVTTSETNEINNRYQTELKNLQNATLKKGEFARQEMALEKQKYDAMFALSHKYATLSSGAIRDGYYKALNQMEKDQGDWSQKTQKLFTGAEHTAASTFVSMAKAHDFSIGQMLQAELEYIGESMIQDGTFNMFRGLATGDAEMAGIGVAEIAAGSVLVGVGSSSAAPSGGGGSSSTASTASNTSQLTQPANQNIQQKQATIVINGDLWNSQEGINHLQSLIRNNSDVTNFAIVQQGKTW